MTACNVREICCNDELIENYHLTAVPLMSMECFLASFSLFCFMARNFTGLVDSHRSHCDIFGHTRQLFSLIKI